MNTKKLMVSLARTRAEAEEAKADYDARMKVLMEDETLQALEIEKNEAKKALDEAEEAVREGLLKLHDPRPHLMMMDTCTSM